MTSPNVLMSMNLGEARRREEAARQRRERNQVSPEIREERARILDARDALRETQQAVAKAAQEARPDAIRAVLQRATVDELNELLRTVGQLDGRRMAEIVGDVLRQRTRTAYVPPSPEPQEAPHAPEASSARRRR